LGNTFDRNVLEPPPTDTVKELNFFLAPVRPPSRPNRQAGAREARQAPAEAKQ
jgi:hypothetical protein